MQTQEFQEQGQALNGHNNELAVTFPLPNSPKSYKVTKYRYVIIVVYVLILFSSGGVYSIFIPFSGFLTRIYGISHVFIVLSGFTFNALYPISSFLIASDFIKRYGLKISVFYNE